MFVFFFLVATKSVFACYNHSDERKATKPMFENRKIIRNKAKTPLSRALFYELNYKLKHLFLYQFFENN